MRNILAWACIGDKSKVLLDELGQEFLSENSFKRNILLEYIKDIDLTLVYQNFYVNQCYDAWINNALEKQGFIQFISEDPTISASKSSIDPMCCRVFLSLVIHPGILVSKTPLSLSSKAFNHYTLLVLSGVLGSTIMPFIFEVERKYCTEQIVENILAQPGTYEIFTDINVPGDFISLNCKKYCVNIIEPDGGSILAYSKEFSNLDEIKVFFRNKKWDYVASTHFSVSGLLETDDCSKRRVDDITIEYLMITNAITRA